MKWIIIFFTLFPVIGYTQTVHMEKERIVYKKTINTDASKEDLYDKAKYAIKRYVRGSRSGLLTDDREKGEIECKGYFRLSSDYNPLQKVQFIIRIKAEDGNYKYHIDSVYLVIRERGEKPQYIPSGDFFARMDISGPVAIATEKQLNEIDMNFQKLLDLIDLAMKRPGKKR